MGLWAFFYRPQRGPQFQAASLRSPRTVQFKPGGGAAGSHGGRCGRSVGAEACGRRGGRRGSQPAEGRVQGGARVEAASPERPERDRPVRTPPPPATWAVRQGNELGGGPSTSSWAYPRLGPWAVTIRPRKELGKSDTSANRISKGHPPFPTWSGHGSRQPAARPVLSWSSSSHGRRSPLFQVTHS